MIRDGTRSVDGSPVADGSGMGTVVGSVPVLGPVFDAVRTVNVWNVQALERHVRRRRSAA